MTAEDVNNLIRSRRSVFPKDYSGEQVSDTVIQAMLENANWAPTHKFTEPWRFIVYSGEGRKKLADLQADLYKKVTQADGTFKEDRFENLKKKPLESSHIILVYMKRDEKKSVPDIEEAGAVFCAIQNIYLTASGYGVGCYLSTGGVTYFPEAKNAFGLSNDEKIIGFLHVGVPKHNNQISRRSPIETKVKWVSE